MYEKNLMILMLKKKNYEKIDISAGYQQARTTYQPFKEKMDKQRNRRS